eukprot:Opistho-1_new@81780
MNGPASPKASRRIAPSKAETDLLEPFVGLGLAQILVPRTAAEFAAASDEILAAGVAGFDTEARPTFRPGEVSDGPHIVQFALPSRAFIFQLRHEASQEALRHLLQSTAVLKVGFGLQSDHGQIHAKLGIQIAAVLDLNTIFRKQGYNSSMGVRAAVGVVLGQNFHKSKKITTSNWAMPQLSERQLLYAANDAYAALKVLEALPPQQLPRLPLS